MIASGAGVGAGVGVGDGVGSGASVGAGVGVDAGLCPVQPTNINNSSVRVITIVRSLGCLITRLT